MKPAVNFENKNTKNKEKNALFQKANNVSKLPVITDRSIYKPEKISEF